MTAVLSMQEYVDYVWSEQLWLLVAIATILGLGKGGVPGLATVATAATVATSPPGGLTFAVALQVPILTCIDISAACLYAKDIHRECILLLIPLSFCGMVIGVWLDARLSDAEARLLVGLFLLFILGVQIRNTDDAKASSIRGDGKPSGTGENDDDAILFSQVEGGKRQSPSFQSTDHRNQVLIQRRSRLPSSDDSSNEEDAINLNYKMDVESSISSFPSPQTQHQNQAHRLNQSTKWVWASIVGLVGGAATMLTNAMGPILNVYLLSVVQLSPSSYIGTRALFFCILNCGKLPMRVWSGSLGLEMIPLAAVLGLVSVLGVFGAKPILLSIPKERFVQLELAVVAFSGLRLCWMGLKELSAKEKYHEIS